jgi:hypothetical protein
MGDASPRGWQTVAPSPLPFAVGGPRFALDFPPGDL